MIRVLNVLVGLQRGGIETFLMNVYSKIDKSKIQFDFLITDKRDSDYKDEVIRLGGNVFTYSSRRDSLWQNYKDVDSFFKTHKYSIVHFHISSLSNIAPIFAAYHNNVGNIIIHSHSSNVVGSLHKILHRMNKLLIKRFSSHYLACSYDAAKWMYPSFIIKESLYKIIPNGINLDKFSFSIDKREEMRKKLNIDSTTLLFGHVGRFSFPKNHLFLLEVFKAIHNTIKNSKLVLVGKGEKESVIKEKILELNLSSDVIFFGESDKVDFLMASFDAFIMPSFYEGLPVVLVEAQASGLPCFVSNSVTNDIKVTNLINYISLNKSPSYWASEIIERMNDNLLSSRYVISDCKDLIDFDIKKVTVQLEKFYSNIEKVK